MTTALSDYLDRLSDSQLATITYLAGFDADLQLSDATFNAYFGSTTVTPQTALQAGATVTFSFAGNAGFTAQEKAYAAQALALWSGMCNINFVYTSRPGQATLVFAKAGTTYQGSTLAAGTYEMPLTGLTTDTEGLIQLTKALIVLDDSGAYGDFGSYTAYAGYGIDALVHEVGHLVGLGHAGPYNGSVNPSVDQNNSTDVRTWSIMSYILPIETSAAYYAEYDPAGVDFGVGDGVYRAPFTPMGLDLFAAQRLYGAPTSTMFVGGNTYGFNSTITYTAIDGTQQLLSMYDFTVDVAPVVTLYSTGTGNTFDISGFAANAVVDLRDGAFSSVAGMSKNIFIEYGTSIDALVAGTGNDLVQANDSGDTMSGNDGNDTLGGGAGGDSLVGGSGDDMLDGAAGDDTMSGGDGGDTYHVDSAGDSVVDLGATGIDLVHATVGFTLPDGLERLKLDGTLAIDGTGNGGDNRITGNSRANLLAGGDGRDVLNGGNGNDTLAGGLGIDSLTGGNGADSFRFTAADEGRDRIADFTPGLDRIEFSAFGFGGGLLENMDVGAAGVFVLGAAATLPTGQFLYNQANGVLYWDSNGTGAGGKVQIAILTGDPALTAAYIRIIF